MSFSNNKAKTIRSFGSEKLSKQHWN